jgi:hypothetical protein
MRIPPGSYIGKRVKKQPTAEVGHFRRCPGCGVVFDCRDLGQAAYHVGPLSHRRRITCASRKERRCTVE